MFVAIKARDTGVSSAMLLQSKSPSPSCPKCIGSASISMLQSSSSSSVSAIIAKYYWAKEADRRLARMINNVSVKLRAVIEEYQLFTQELEASPGWVVNKDRSIEYLQELVQRDEEMVQRLQALEREVDERADEKLVFIEKLKGNVPFE
ncbi:hypothetical protein Tco_1503876 [Tanacetum coccineum]